MAIDKNERTVLKAYLQSTDSGRWTSQDICDDLSNIITLRPDDVTDYMLEQGHTLERRDDRLVWVISK